MIVYNNQQSLLNNMSDNVNAAKRSFYATLGTSIFKTSLSPKSISTVYWSVFVSKLLYACEIRHFHCEELDLYERHHRIIAKIFYIFPKTAPMHRVCQCLGGTRWSFI